MRARGIAIGLMTFLAASGAAHGMPPGKAPALHRVPLTSAGAVTSLDVPQDPEDPGAGGGFDSETYFTESLVTKLVDCTNRIEDEIKKWSQSRGLRIRKKKKSPGALLVHALKQGETGFFELVYKVNAKQKRARVTLYYYSNDGSQLEPIGINSILNSYGIGELHDRLDNALQCKGK